METHKVFVGCCMVILNPSGDKVLVARRKKEPDLGGYQIPGGTVDYAQGENMREAIVREVEEETGLLIPDPKLLCLMNSFYYGKERPLHIAFLSKVETENLPPNPEPHKAEDWQWVELENLPEGPWFRMSKAAIDFYKALQKDPNLDRFYIDEEFISLKRAA